MIGHGTKRTEQGIALIWAILIMLIVLGTIAVSVGMTLVRTDETKDEANRTRSSLWMNAASDDLAQRLQSREIGFDHESVLPGNQDALIVVPVPGMAPGGGTTAFRNPGPTAGTTNARRIQYTVQGRTYRGWYQVLPPRQGAQPWRALLHRAAGPGGSLAPMQGSIDIMVRAWEDGRRAEPVVAKLTFRRASFSRFSLLSDDKMTIQGGGRLGGFIHTNNARSANPAIRLTNAGALVGTQKITTTQGGISGPCPSGKCIPNVGDTVEFGAGARSFDRLRQFSAATIPTAGASYAGAGVARFITPSVLALSPVNANRMPVYFVDLGRACGNGGLAVGRGDFALRNDTVGVPILDDDRAPNLTVLTCLPVADGGGAFLFDGDVVVRGVRTDNRTVTIMSQRITKPSVRLDVDGNPATPMQSVRVTMPASIYLAQTGNNAGVGSSNPYSPVGLVAESGVYLPSWAMETTARDMRVLNVAAMAVGGEIGYGPSIISVAAENNDVGLGLRPSAAQGFGYGHGCNLVWNGALASRRPINFVYGNGGGSCNSTNYLGYSRRSLSYAPDLMWNPPAEYPTDRDWHQTDYKEFSQ